ncbi:MAG: hypothetical protein WKG06_40360 [Segetibacter sp.]
MQYETLVAKHSKRLLHFFCKREKRVNNNVFDRCCCFSFSRYLPVKKDSVNKNAFQQELAQLKIVIDSSQDNKSYQRDENYADYSQPKP